MGRRRLFGFVGLHVCVRARASHLHHVCLENVISLVVSTELSSAWTTELKVHLTGCVKNTGNKLEAGAFPDGSWNRMVPAAHGCCDVESFDRSKLSRNSQFRIVNKGIKRMNERMKSRDISQLVMFSCEKGEIKSCTSQSVCVCLCVFVAS